MDDNITRNVLKFADDTNVFRKVNTDGDKQHLQNDLDILVNWSEKWQMLFNLGKCKCLHTGRWNLDINCNVGDTVLDATVLCRTQHDCYETTTLLTLAFFSTSYLLYILKTLWKITKKPPTKKYGRHVFASCKIMEGAIYLLE